MKKDLLVLIVFTIVWVCKPISYEELAVNKYANSQSVSNVLLVRAGDAGFDPSSFVPPKVRPDSTQAGQSSVSKQSLDRVYKSKIQVRVAPGTGGGGDGSGDDSYNNDIPLESQWETNSKTWENFQNDPRFYGRDKKGKKENLETCSINDAIAEQNKAGIEDLPDSSKFIYDLEGKPVKGALKNVWKNPKAKKEVLAGLSIMDRDELVPRNQKDFKGFKDIKEIKLNDTRMLVRPGKNGKPDEIVAIVMRRDLKDLAAKLKNKLK